MDGREWTHTKKTDKAVRRQVFGIEKVAKMHWAVVNQQPIAQTLWSLTCFLHFSTVKHSELVISETSSGDDVWSNTRTNPHVS